MVDAEFVREELLQRWQTLMNTAASILRVPAGLIMRVDQDEIEVLVSSRTKGNPYEPGDRERLWDSGLYCEQVVKTRRKLLVPDARADVDWDSNPDIELGMVSYLGLPLLWPDGSPFGTICVLDSKRNEYSLLYERFLSQLKEVVEADLALLARQAGAEAESAPPALQGIIPICSYCHSVRNERGEWETIEVYLRDHYDVEFSHGFCLECLKVRHPRLYRKRYGGADDTGQQVDEPG